MPGSWLDHGLLGLVFPIAWRIEGRRGRVAHQTRHSIPHSPLTSFNPYDARTSFPRVENAGALPLYPTRVPHRYKYWGDFPLKMILIRPTGFSGPSERALHRVDYHSPQSRAQTRPLEVKVSRRPYPKPRARRPKQKAKEDLAGGGRDFVGHAIGNRCDGIRREGLSGRILGQ